MIDGQEVQWYNDDGGLISWCDSVELERGPRAVAGVTDEAGQLDPPPDPQHPVIIINQDSSRHNGKAADRLIEPDSL